MPAGVSWNAYVKFLCASLVTMFAGSQTVHIIYRPLENLDQLIEEEKQKILNDSKK